MHVRVFFRCLLTSSRSVRWQKSTTSTGASSRLISTRTSSGLPSRTSPSTCPPSLPSPAPSSKPLPTRKACLAVLPLQSAPLLQPLLIPMPATATGANALRSGELKSLHLSTETRQIPKDPKAHQPHAPTVVAITRLTSAVVCKTSSLSTGHVSLSGAAASPSPHFIAAALGAPTSSALECTTVGVTQLLTGAGAVVGATVQPTGVSAVVGAMVQLGAMDITAGAARSLGARTVSASPLTLLLALILTTSLCPSRGTMLLCVKLSKPTARPPTSSELQSPLPRARSLWSLLPPLAASS